ncbi:MAG: 2-amino-4-hydroxy-6-hydroxymethyldihydropteridine diphosphokinase [Candidatus Thermoplasmatota archaeon]|nr:2-amino-4-hydroxy-6-hydroxymethyldihydropteridine diphosphokinase [Candidatus Thermoplasmatota archaeon]
MADIYVALGSNIEPETNIVLAIRNLMKVFRLHSISTVYRTGPLRNMEQPDYYNLVLRGSSHLRPHELKFSHFRRIETSLGRVRTADKFESRTIDIDLLIYGQECIETGDLLIPDPDIWERPFLAASIYELNPALEIACASLDIKYLARKMSRRGMTPLPVFTRKLRQFLSDNANP